ncbi:hypothetical protein BASA81_009862 [Batrachochytrium salamandrivorans]|nr:hypothetical protein BASA81_009862 [Batrachochytrium salamandrivorans]
MSQSSENLSATAAGGGSSFSAWFKEAEQKANAGGDPLASSSSAASSRSFAVPKEYVPDWMRSYAPSGLIRERDDLESGELLSTSTAATGMGGDGINTNDYALSKTEKFKWFVALLSLGVLFFVLSFFFLGVVIVFPGKFAFSFTCGSLSVMSAFILMQGFGAWRREVCHASRLWFSLCYFGSIAGTLFATLYLRNYVAILVCSGLQLSSLGWYFATYIPGGQHGMRMINAIVRNTCGTCFKACRLCVGI